MANTSSPPGSSRRCCCCTALGLLLLLLSLFSVVDGSSRLTYFSKTTTTTASPLVLFAFLQRSSSSSSQGGGRQRQQFLPSSALNLNSKSDIINGDKHTVNLQTAAGGSLEEYRSARTTTTSMSSSNMLDTLSFITDICGKLKLIKRTGWVRCGVPLPESDSDHMHRCAMLAMLVGQNPISNEDDYTYEDGKYSKYHPNNINQNKLLRMALTHDLCESIAGDITPFCSQHLLDKKHVQEELAMKQIQNVVGGTLGKELYELWEEYELQQTPESIYCKDIDKFEMIVQAYEYEKLYLQKQKCTKKKDDNTNGESESKVNGTSGETAVAEGEEENDDGDAAADVLESNDGETNSNNDTPKVLTEPLRTFFITTNGKFQTPIFRRLDYELRTKRSTLIQELGYTVSKQEEIEPPTFFQL